MELLIAASVLLSICGFFGVIDMVYNMFKKPEKIDNGFIYKLHQR